MRIDLPPAAPRQLGQRVERRLGPAEMIDELAKGDGPDVSLRISRRQASRWASSSGACGNGAGVSRVRVRLHGCDDLAPILLSSPARRRRMLAWCLAKIRSAMMRMTGRPAQPVIA